MKVKVVVKFKDKYTSSWHNVDEVLIVSEERYKEIERFVKVIIDEKPKGSEKPPEVATLRAEEPEPEEPEERPAT